MTAIADAARELVAMRDRWLNPDGSTRVEMKSRTLTNLYNQRPTWLDLAHKKLDAAVFAAYGWEGELGDEEVLDRPLALNLERAQWLKEVLQGSGLRAIVTGSTTRAALSGEVLCHVRSPMTGRPIP